MLCKINKIRCVRSFFELQGGVNCIRLTWRSSTKPCVKHGCSQHCMLWVPAWVDGKYQASLAQ